MCDQHIPVFRKKIKPMNHEWLNEDETLEDLQLHGLKLIQKKDGFRLFFVLCILLKIMRIMIF